MGLRVEVIEFHLLGPLDWHEPLDHEVKGAVPRSEAKGDLTMVPLGISTFEGTSTSADIDEDVCYGKPAAVKPMDSNEVIPKKSAEDGG